MKNILFKKKSSIFFLITGLYLLIATNSNSQILDSSFGKGGLVKTDINGLQNNSELTRAAAVQTDGKIVVVSNYYSNGYCCGDILIVRYQSNGNLDSSFGINGSIITNFKEYQSSSQYGKTINVLKDGKILVGGDYYGIYKNIPANYQFLIQYQPNGNLDSSFGISGKATGVLGETSSVEVQQDGKILISGGSVPVGDGLHDKRFNVAQYQSTGAIDSSFGINGITSVVFDTILYNDLANVVAIQNDQKILVGGYTYQKDTYYLALVRLRENGELDSSFGSDGKVVTDFEKGFIGRINAIIEQHDEKIIVSAGDGYDFVRYHSDGSVDSIFGIDGKVKVAGRSSPAQQSMVIQEDGKFLVCGTYFPPLGFYQFQIMRFSNNGIVDSLFGTNGSLKTEFNVNTAASCIILQPNGNFVVGGLASYYYQGNFANDLALVRYISDDVLATTWNNFTANKKEKTVLLNWQTANESNNAYFSVERSSNGSNKFYAIDKVPGKGNSAQLQPYIFEDINPLKGCNYYRLKQVDADGHFSYSKILLVDFETAAAIKLYPNPVKDILRIEGLNSTGATSLAIVDLSGRVMARATNSNTNTYTWNIQTLPSGMYYIIINSTTQRSTLKLLKE